jgi:hypothetical protein
MAKTETASQHRVVRNHSSELISSSVDAIREAKKAGRPVPDWALSNLEGLQTTTREAQLPALAISFDISQEAPETPYDKRRGVLIGDRVVKVHEFQWEMLKSLADHQGNLMSRDELISRSFPDGLPVKKSELISHTKDLAGRISVAGEPLITVERTPSGITVLGIDRFKLVPITDSADSNSESAQLRGGIHPLARTRELFRRHSQPKPVRG